MVVLKLFHDWLGCFPRFPKHGSKQCDCQIFHPGDFISHIRHAYPRYNPSVSRGLMISLDVKGMLIVIVMMIVVWLYGCFEDDSQLFGLLPQVSRTWLMASSSATVK